MLLLDFSWRTIVIEREFVPQVFSFQLFLDLLLVVFVDSCSLGDAISLELQSDVLHLLFVITVLIFEKHCFLAAIDL